MSDTKTVYISIANTGDRLTQTEWAAFAASLRGAVRHAAHQVVGEWVSLPWSSSQNACWCIEINPDQIFVTAAGKDVRNEVWLRARLSDLAVEYGQYAITWAEATTELIKAGLPDYDLGDERVRQ